MNEALEIALSSARWWRDFGTDMVIIGIAAEIFIEAFLKTESSQFTPREEHRRERFKKFAIFLAGLIVVGGITLEITKGDSADDISDKISHEQLALIRTQADKIITLERLLLPRILVDRNSEWGRSNASQEFVFLRQPAVRPAPTLNTQALSVVPVVYLQVVPDDREAERFARDLELVLKLEQIPSLRVFEDMTRISPDSILEGVAVIPIEGTDPNSPLSYLELTRFGTRLSVALAKHDIRGAKGELVGRKDRFNIQYVPGEPPVRPFSLRPVQGIIFVEIGSKPVSAELLRLQQMDDRPAP